MSSVSVLKTLQAHGSAAVSLAFPKDRFRLHAMLTSAGYDLCRDRVYDWHGLKRGEAPFVLLQHTVSGRGQLRCGGRRFTLRAGQTMLLSFPDDNRYWLARGDQWEFFWLCLNGREVLRLWQELARCGPVVELAPGDVERLAACCLSLLRGEVRAPARASAMAYEVSMHLADALLSWGEVRTVSKRPAAIERAISLCQGNPAELLDVDRLARAAGYSRYHFTRLFTEAEGVPPARYLLRLRMERAARLLQMGQDPIKVVARSCGFEDANYFTKVFRRFFGIGPRDFRTSGMFAGASPPSASGLSQRSQP